MPEAKSVQGLSDLHEGDTVQFVREKGDRVFQANVVKTRTGPGHVKVGLATDDGAISTYMPVTGKEIKDGSIVIERTKKAPKH